MDIPLRPEYVGMDLDQKIINTDPNFIPLSVEKWYNYEIKTDAYSLALIRKNVPYFDNLFTSKGKSRYPRTDDEIETRLRVWSKHLNLPSFCLHMIDRDSGVKRVMYIHGAIARWLS